MSLNQFDMNSNPFAQKEAKDMEIEARRAANESSFQRQELHHAPGESTITPDRKIKDSSRNKYLDAMCQGRMSPKCGKTFYFRKDFADAIESMIPPNSKMTRGDVLEAILMDYADGHPDFNKLVEKFH